MSLYFWMHMKQEKEKKKRKEKIGWPQAWSCPKCRMRNENPPPCSTCGHDPRDDMPECNGIIPQGDTIFIGDENSYVTTAEERNRKY